MKVEQEPVKELVRCCGRPQRGRWPARVGHLRRLTRHLGLQGVVRFEGTAPQEALPLYYSAADVCVVPSYYESFGLVALEAMACGTPVVAARVGGLASLVQHGRTGYLVSWHCPEPYVNALEALLANPDLREAMGRAAHQAAQEFSWGRTARQVAQVYAEVTAEVAPRALQGCAGDGGDA